MFTYAEGRPIRPEYLTHRFRQICKEPGLPPIRLHDLRPCAATLASLASHTDLKVIQQMLGHSSIITTADTYTSVLPEAAHRAAPPCATAATDQVMSAAAMAPPVPMATAMPRSAAASAGASLMLSPDHSRGGALAAQPGDERGLCLAAATRRGRC